MGLSRVNLKFVVLIKTYRLIELLLTQKVPEVICEMSVTLHTDVGDLKFELFCEDAPKACENFLALCASDYYNGCVFHR